MNDVIQLALDVNQAFLALGCEQFEGGGARFVRDRTVPSIRDANHVSHVAASTPAEIDWLLARADREFEGMPHRAFHLDFRTPPAFEARLAHEGYRRNDAVVMVLERDLAGEAKAFDIQLVDNDEAWAAYAALHEADWREYHARLNEPEARSVGEVMLHTRQAKSPPVRFWLAYMDGEPRAYLASWEGPEGAGQVEDLFTHPDYRHRGLATALIHHCVADCRAHGAGPIVIVADPDDTPKRMYAALGFRPIAVKRNYWKEIAR